MSQRGTEHFAVHWIPVRLCNGKESSRRLDISSRRTEFARYKPFQPVAASHLYTGPDVTSRPEPPVGHSESSAHP